MQSRAHAALTALAASAALIASGCAATETPTTGADVMGEPIAWDELPERVQDVVTNALPGIEITYVERKKIGSSTFYEIDGVWTNGESYEFIAEEEPGGRLTVNSRRSSDG